MSSPAAQNHKRPLEDTSSPSSTADQPDAKRPAFDKVKDDVTIPAPVESADDDTAVETDPVPAVADAPLTHSNHDADSSRTDPPLIMPSREELLETRPIQSAPVQQQHVAPDAMHMPQDESQWLHLRSIISSSEAATIIGKGGENVSRIRAMSGAKCTVSDYSRGAVERVLTVSGLVDAVAKAFGLITRTLNEEPLDQPSHPQSKTYALRLLIPHLLIGPIIGKAGQRIREIQEASGSRLNASDGCLPLSSERSVVVLGVADAVHIATYYIGSTLVEQLTERFGGPAASAYATRGGHASGSLGGLHVVPYTPQHAGGQWGAGDHLRRMPQGRGMPPGPYPHHQQGYGPSMPMQQNHMPMHMGAASARGAGPGGYMGAGPQGYTGQPPQPPVGGYAAPPQQPPQPPAGQAITQQIFIPNDMVGAIIGKGGSKINEIRQLSGSNIKINEPQDNSVERLVSITGTQESNQMALYMLYNKLGQHT